MSLYELGESTGEVSLSEMFAAPFKIDGSANMNIDKLAFVVCSGGWSQVIGLRVEIALDQAIDYYHVVIH